MTYVLTPLSKQKLTEIFDDKALEIFKFQFEKNVLALPEIKKGQTQYALQIPNEYFEQWCSQAIGAERIGAGSYPVDIIKDDWGADVKSLSCKLTPDGSLSKSESGETSLAQKFKDAGIDLDESFKNKEYELIKTLWLEIVRKKNQKVIDKKKLKNIYYFFFLRGLSKYYLCGMEVVIGNIPNVGVDLVRTTAKSVYLSNYLNPRYGSTKIYKAKKRLELRLLPKNWKEDDLLIEIEIPAYLPSIDLRKTDLDLYKEVICKFWLD